MKSTRFRLLMSAVVFAVVALSSACSGDESPGTASASQPASAAGSAPSVAPSAPASAAAQGFCAEVQQQRALLQGTELAGLLAGGNKDAWKSYLDKVTAMNQRLVDTAPAEIKADVKILQDTTVALKAKMEAVDYDVTKLGTAQLVQVLQTPERKTATANIVAYVKTNCGIDLTAV
jgi:hypothetical protein